MELISTTFSRTRWWRLAETRLAAPRRLRYRFHVPPVAPIQPVTPPPEPRAKPMLLENGDLLTAVEFLRRYNAMPHVRKAELIEGIV